MTWNTMQKIRNCRTERQTKEIWDTYLKQRRESERRNGKKHNKKDSKK